MAASPSESGQADFSVPAVGVGVQVHILVFDCSPQVFLLAVVVATLPSCPADLDRFRIQPGYDVIRDERTALVGVEDLWLAITFQRHLQGIQTELRDKAVRELSAEHVPGEENHDRHQVEEALLERDGGAVGRPGPVHCLDLFEVHQTGGIASLARRGRAAGLLADRPSTHPAAAAAGSLQVESIDPPHEPQGRFTQRYRLLEKCGCGQDQRRSLAADTVIRVVVIDQCASFTGIRAAETLLSHSSSICTLLLCCNSSAYFPG